MFHIAKVDQSIANKIKNFIKNLVNRLEKAIRGLQGQSVEANQLRELDLDDIQELKAHWMSALIDARDNVLQARKNDAKAQKNTTDEGDVKHQARFKGHTNIEKNGNKRYNKHSFYSSFDSLAMNWAYHPDTQVGDTNIFFKNDVAVLIEATEDGFTEISSGNYEEMRSINEQAHRKPNRGLYANLNRIEARRNADSWDLQYVENGRYDVRDAQQDESQGIQVDSERDNEHLRSGDKRKSVKFQDRDYSYNALVSKPDMKITVVDDSVVYSPSKLTRKDVVDNAIKNANSVGYTNENGNAVVYVNDIGTDVIVSKNGLRHGLDRRLQILAPITLKAGEILENSIRINELNPANENVNNSYVLIGAAKNSKNEPYIVSFVVNRTTNEVTSIDVLYSVNAKKESAGLNDPGVPAKNADYLTDSVISISDLLEYVNKYFPDILPEDVLKHFGYTERPEGKIGESTLFQERPISDREILVDAMSNSEGVTIEDKNRLEIYRKKIDNITELEKELADVGKQIHKIIKTKGSDRKQLDSLNEKANTLRKKISRVDGELLRIEAMKPIKNLVEIRKKQMLKAYKQKTQEQRHKNVEGRNKTVTKNKIKRVVKTLESLYGKPTKEKNVKIEFQDMVKKALVMADVLFDNSALATHTILSGDITTRLSTDEKELIAEWKECNAKIKERNDELVEIDNKLGDKADPKVRKAKMDSIKHYSTKRWSIEQRLSGVLERQREEIEETAVQKAIESLVKAYKSLNKSTEGYVKAAYTTEVYDKLVSIAEDISGTKIRDMTLKQMNEVYQAYKIPQ